MKKFTNNNLHKYYLQTTYTNEEVYKQIIYTHIICKPNEEVYKQIIYTNIICNKIIYINIYKQRIQMKKFTTQKQINYSHKQIKYAPYIHYPHTILLFTTQTHKSYV
jgi:hypothetical protein